MNTELNKRHARPLAETLPHDEVTDVRALYAAPPGDRDAPPAGRYEHIATLGVGGMGRVSLCHDRRLGRDAAVKTLREDLVGVPGSRARFLREARIQAQLDHPCVVPVFDIERSDTPRFSMRHVRGELLSDVLERLRAGDPAAARSFSRRRLLTAFSSVCGAVHFAHMRGVLHRDLKPENVMLGEFGEVYVLDWGVARVLDEPGARVDASLPPEYATERGQVYGTPGFIAPEAWISRDVGARADVYSLGVVLFEILTHSACHEGANPRELMRSTLCARPPVPSARRPDLAIPPELDRVCATAMALTAEERYASASELRDAVERVLDGEETARREAAAPPASSPMRVAPWARLAWVALWVLLGSATWEGLQRLHG